MPVMMTEEQRKQAQAATAKTKELRKDIDALYAEYGPKCLPEKTVARIKYNLETMPAGYRINYLRALKGRSTTAGIKAHCLECVGWEREGVRGCTSPQCALYPYRPFK